MALQPTSKQLKRFWEDWCSFKTGPLTVNNYAFKREELLTHPDGTKTRVPKGSYVELDSNSILKYALPRVLEKHSLVESYSFKQDSGLYYSETSIWDKDSRQLKGSKVSSDFQTGTSLEEAELLSRFWAIYRIIEEDKEKS